MTNVGVTGVAVKGKKKMNLDYGLKGILNFDKKMNTEKVWTSKLNFDFRLVLKLLFFNCIYFMCEICV